jgi:hypothetical protein
MTTPNPPWTPFEKAVLPPINMDHVRDQARATGKSVEEVLAVYQAIVREEKVFLNSRYQVNIRECSDGRQPMLHLSIKRRDKQPIHDWRDLQRIKNELVAPGCEAVEIYPAESRLVDTANQYHLFVYTDPTYRIPFGFTERLVTETPGGNAVQRPFEAAQHG